MRFLDLDLDFFLNKNSYYSGHEDVRLGPEYKPWSASRVRHFLEDRCGLSHDNPLPGRTIKSHDEVLDFWHMLIESGRIKIPFDVIHIDVHPDLWVGGVLYLKSDFLFFDPERGLAILKNKQIHSGNYLTLAIAYRWIGSLVWVPLLKFRKDQPEWDGDVRSGLKKFKKRKSGGHPIRSLPVAERECSVHFQILPWHEFRTSKTFGYMALCKSPGFTPPESDGLISIIEEYMKQI
jgi:hypothetical protein